MLLLFNNNNKKVIVIVINNNVIAITSHPYFMQLQSETQTESSQTFKKMRRVEWSRV